MSAYGILRAIPMSFYSRHLYRDVAINWGGKVFFYLLFILALSWIPTLYFIQHSISSVYAQNSDKIADQIPILTIQNGKLSTPEAKPYIVTFPNSQENLMIIDTSGQYSHPADANAYILVTPEAIFSKPNPNQVRVDRIPNLNLVINPQTVNQFIKRYIGFSWIIFLIIFTIAAFIYRLIQTLLYSILGKIFSLFFFAHLSFMQIMQIAIVAITPALVCATLVDTFALHLPHQLWVYFALTLIYLFYGILANKF